MIIDRLGERAAILRDIGTDPAQFAAAVEAAGLPGLIEAVACYDTVGLFFDDRFDLASLASVDREAPPLRVHAHRIPVCYPLGEDLADVCTRLALTEPEFVERHANREYRCFAVGFCPGFPYLGYLPEDLSGIPRRANPRTRVEPGSVAITGRQTGVYPMARPGGWAIVGRTPLVLVDVEERYFPIQAGDTVRFEAIDEAEYRARLGERL